MANPSFIDTTVHVSEHLAVVFCNIEAGYYAVLVEAISPIGTAVMGAVDATDFLFAVLGVECFEIEDRMVVG